MIEKIRFYIRQTTGAISILAAILFPVVIGSASFAVDLSMAHMVKQRLSHAIDSAALAAAASAGGGTAAEITAKVEQFFYQNYPSGEIGDTYDLTVSISGDDITVSAKSLYNTNFAKFLGIDEIVVTARTTVTREIMGLEVALVLDVTGSMNTNNNIGTLRTSAQSFLDILCPNETCSSLIKIGIVPFASTVNVGPYGLGKNPNGSTYDTAFVNNPSGKTFNQSKTKQWWGCVLERTPPQDTQNYGSGWKWNMYNYSSGDPNYGCNKSYLLPLTNVYGTLSSKIGGLYASGYTLSNIGMVWGYRLLSPEAPFREGALWTDTTVKKVAILMTDGDNNITDYTAYGNWSTYRLTDHDLDVKLATTCQNMKDSGITIYTVTFTSGINPSTKDYFRNCASSEDKYFDAPEQEDLENAFEDIARELSNIHIKS